MVELVLSITQTEILWESDMLGILIAAYFFLLICLFVGFLNIYSVDKYEFAMQKQVCVKFKHRVFFIISYSKDKHIISKKTLIMEIIGYILSLVSIIICIVSFGLNVSVAFVLLGVMAALDLAFATITGFMYSKIPNPIDFDKLM